MQEEELIKGLRRQEASSYEYLIETYSAYLVSVVHKISHGQLDADEIELLCSEVFITLWTKGKENNITPGKLKAYMAVMARHKTLNYLRRKNHFKWQPYNGDEDALEAQILNSGHQVMTPEETIIAREERAALDEALSTLSAIEQEIFVRRYFYREKVHEIAAHTGINRQTVGTKLLRGKKKLKMALKERGIYHE